MSQTSYSEDTPHRWMSSHSTNGDNVDRVLDRSRRRRARSTASEASTNESSKSFEQDTEDGFADNDEAQNGPAPHWQRVLAASRVGRQEHSRASSVISCRTRLTTSTDDARSVEFEAGGRSFRINRYGSSVVDVTAPPPYPGPPLEELIEASDEEDTMGSSDRASIDTTRRISRETPTRVSMDIPDLPIRTHLPKDTSHEEVPTSSSRVGNVLELPQRLRSILSIRWNSGGALDDPPESSPKLKVLRRTQSESSTLGKARPYLPDGSRHDDSSDEAVYLESHKQIDGLKPENEVEPNKTNVEDEHARSLQDLDHDYRRKLHDRDNELARMRSLLDEKDKILRQQLRERDFAIEVAQNQLIMKDRIINDLKKTIYETDEGIERRVEKARNEVEDTWEKRWKEYERLLLTRMEASNSNDGPPSTPANNIGQLSD